MVWGISKPEWGRDKNKSLYSWCRIHCALVLDLPIPEEQEYKDKHTNNSQQHHSNTHTCQCHAPYTANSIKTYRLHVFLIFGGWFKIKLWLILWADILLNMICNIRKVYSFKTTLIIIPSAGDCVMLIQVCNGTWNQMKIPCG